MSTTEKKPSNNNTLLGNSEPINSSTPTTNKIVSFLGRKNNFNPIKPTSSKPNEVPLTRLQKLALNIGKMWNDSFGRRVIAFTALFISSAYFIAIPKFNTYIKNSQQDEDDEDDDDGEE
ncbi:hypothetical protein NAEGRDRAFT_79093 [Naegleria gruberi]|uniref:Transmembrane protein n=1 Tax=Naegleria gruberi TaxID=5762 RepID=D2V9Q5_NAEGR|nr:uncharacterized protein NAEGRDRAFT_79093 [Naegleria gruberi]EFC46627.1 hypothetical protein NAEGRDRAFT_79093 [Naegleria gruberi]|eukprot:XP_002679371.1 hypothetical protein NAEGRDRAFT_79093 [Naegleria gruberi strain NEG-M]